MENTFKLLSTITWVLSEAEIIIEKNFLVQLTIVALMVTLIVGWHTYTSR